MYSQDYDERTMPFCTQLAGGDNGCFWKHDLLYPYTKNRQMYFCPSGGRDNAVVWGAPWGDSRYGDYGYHCPTSSNVRLADLKAPAAVMMFIESAHAPACPNDNCNFPARVDWVTKPHNDGTNLVYWDGHVKWQNWQLVNSRVGKGSGIWYQDGQDR